MGVMTIDAFEEEGFGAEGRKKNPSLNISNGSSESGMGRYVLCS